MSPAACGSGPAARPLRARAAAWLALGLAPCACSGMLDLPAALLDPDGSGPIGEPDSGPRPDAGPRPDSGPLRDSGADGLDAGIDLVCEYQPCTTACGGAGRQMCLGPDCDDVGRCLAVGEDCAAWGDQSCLPVGSDRDRDDPCCRVPQNDRCDSARDIGFALVAGGCTQMAGNDAEDPGVASAGPDEHFLWRLAGRSRVTFSLLQATFDTALYVRTACDDPQSTLGSNDDSGSGCVEGAETSEVTLDLEPGDYYLVVDSPTADDRGYFRLNIGVIPL